MTSTTRLAPATMRTDGQQVVRVFHQYIQASEGGEAVGTGELTQSNGSLRKGVIPKTENQPHVPWEFGLIAANQAPRCHGSGPPFVVINNTSGYSEKRGELGGVFCN